MPVTSVRELRVLQTCRHPNLVALRRVVTGARLDSVFLVFEYAPHDLGRLVDSLPAPFQESEVKCLMLQARRGLDGGGPAGGTKLDGLGPAGPAGAGPGSSQPARWLPPALPRPEYSFFRE